MFTLDHPYLRDFHIILNRLQVRINNTMLRYEQHDLIYDSLRINDQFIQVLLSQFEPKAAHQLAESTERQSLEHFFHIYLLTETYLLQSSCAIPEIVTAIKPHFEKLIFLMRIYYYDLRFMFDQVYHLEGKLLPDDFNPSIVGAIEQYQAASCAFYQKNQQQFGDADPIQNYTEAFLTSVKSFVGNLDYSVLDKTDQDILMRIVTNFVNLLRSKYNMLKYRHILECMQWLTITPLSETLADDNWAVFTSALLKLYFQFLAYFILRQPTFHEIYSVRINQQLSNAQEIFGNAIPEPDYIIGLKLCNKCHRTEKEFMGPGKNTIIHYDCKFCHLVICSDCYEFRSVDSPDLQHVCRGSQHAPKIFLWTNHPRFRYGISEDDGRPLIKTRIKPGEIEFSSPVCKPKPLTANSAGAPPIAIRYATPRPKTSPSPLASSEDEDEAEAVAALRASPGRLQRLGKKLLRGSIHKPLRIFKIPNFHNTNIECTICRQQSKLVARCKTHGLTLLTCGCCSDGRKIPMTKSDVPKNLTNFWCIKCHPLLAMLVPPS